MRTQREIAAEALGTDEIEQDANGVWRRKKKPKKKAAKKKADDE